MKELEVTVRLRNNRLKARRLALGMNQRAFAAAARVSLAGYRDLEAMQMSPVRADGGWRRIAIDVAAWHCVDLAELFPASVRAVNSPVVVRTMDADELPSLAAPTDETVARIEMREHVHDALARLSARERMVIERMYGIGHPDEQEVTAAELAAELGVSRRYVDRVAARALRRLKHKTMRPDVSLRGCYD